MTEEQNKYVSDIQKLKDTYDDVATIGLIWYYILSFFPIIVSFLTAILYIWISKETILLYINIVSSAVEIVKKIVPTIERYIMHQRAANDLSKIYEKFTLRQQPFNNLQDTNTAENNPLFDKFYKLTSKIKYDLEEKKVKFHENNQKINNSEK